MPSRTDRNIHNKEVLELPLSMYSAVAHQQGSTKLFVVLFETYLFNRNSRKPVSYHDLTSSKIHNNIFSRFIKSEADYLECVDTLADMGIMHRTGSCAVYRGTRRTDFFNQCDAKYLKLKGTLGIDLLNLKSKVWNGATLPYLLAIEVIRAVKGIKNYSIGFYTKLTGLSKKRLKTYFKQAMEDGVITSIEASKILLTKKQRDQLKYSEHNLPIKYADLSKGSLTAATSGTDKYKAKALYVDQGNKINIVDQHIVSFSLSDNDLNKLQKTKLSAVVNDNSSAVFNEDADSMPIIVDLGGVKSKVQLGYISMNDLTAKDYINDRTRFVLDELKNHDVNNIAVVTENGKLYSLQQYIRYYR